MKNIFVYYPEGHEDHYEIGHPERPERIEAIREALISAGWWDEFKFVQPYVLDDDLLFSIHSQSYINTLKSVSEYGGHLDGDTYTTPSSWKLALNAAGGANAVADNVWMSGKCLNEQKPTPGFALTRPPGHHATLERGMGFCLLNNIALAAQHLLSVREATRLAIIDLDLHHGNGTQDIFWERDDVFYISTHQSPLYPGTGSLEETGNGVGEGFTANFPLPPATGDEGFGSVMASLILPILDFYCPEMILVSYGFDPHWRDPLGHLQMSAAGYGELIGSLKDWAEINCSGRIALFLEGGYDLDAGRACSQAIVAKLLDEPWEDPLGPSPRKEGSSWEVVARRAQEIWRI